MVELVLQNFVLINVIFWRSLAYMEGTSPIHFGVCQFDLLELLTYMERTSSIPSEKERDVCSYLLLIQILVLFHNLVLSNTYGIFWWDCVLLWDTAGNKDYDRLGPLPSPNNDVMLMCFFIDRPDSLGNIAEKWTPEVTHFLLVCNEKDLSNVNKSHRTMSEWDVWCFSLS